MKRAPLTYRRRPWPPQKLARLREIERAFQVRAFGEELARVNFELTIEERHRYLEGMRELGRRNRRAKALAKTNLPADEAKKWHRDLQDAHKTLKPPADKWQ